MDSLEGDPDHMKPKLVFSTSIYFALSISLLGLINKESTGQIPIGARPLGMGESFVAIADDANAISWNPAGLVQLRQQAINGMYTDLYGIGLVHSYLSYILPLTDQHVIGIDWSSLGFEDEELNLRDNRMNLSYGIRLVRQLSLGTNFRYVSMNTLLDGESLGAATGLGVDLGVYFEPISGLSFGIFGKDLTNTKVKFETTKREDIVAYRQFRLGASYQLTDSSVIACDLDDSLHLGVEQWFGNLLALRGGIIGSLISLDSPNSDETFREPTSFSLGGSLKYGALQFDYAYLNSPTLSNTHRFSMAFGFDYNPTLIDIGSIQLRDVLTSFYLQYGTPNPLSGELILSSKHNKDMIISVSVFVPSYMDNSTVVLANKTLRGNTAGQVAEKVRIPLALALNQNVQKLKDDLETEIEITVSYQYLGRIREIKRVEPITLRRMGKVAYRERLDPMVAFIDPDDTIIQSFAQAVSKIPVEIDSTRLDDLQQDNDSLLKAMQIFEALNAYGIRYEPHPETPFQSVYAKEYIVDVTTKYTQNLLDAADLWYIDSDGPFKEAKYPRDFLRTSGVGDCDDGTVLLTSLLEAVGIRTKLVDVGNSVFAMFDSRLTKKDIETLKISSGLFIKDNDRLWIPIEVTHYGKSFIDAWQAGINKFNSAVLQDTLKLVDVHAAWDTYQRMHPSTKPTTIEPPPTAEIAMRVHQNLVALEELKEN